MTKRLWLIVTVQVGDEPVQAPSQRAKLVPGLEMETANVTTVPVSKL